MYKYRTSGSEQSSENHGTSETKISSGSFNTSRVTDVMRETTTRRFLLSVGHSNIQLGKLVCCRSHKSKTLDRVVPQGLTRVTSHRAVLDKNRVKDLMKNGAGTGIYKFTAKRRSTINGKVYRMKTMESFREVIEMVERKQALAVFQALSSPVN